MKNIDQKIIEKLESEKLSQRDIADIIGRTQPSVWRRLHGESGFSAEELQKLIRSRGWDPVELFQE